MLGKHWDTTGGDLKSLEESLGIENQGKASERRVNSTEDGKGKRRQRKKLLEEMGIKRGVSQG